MTTNRQDINQLWCDIIFFLRLYWQTIYDIKSSVKTLIAKTLHRICHAKHAEKGLKSNKLKSKSCLCAILGRNSIATTKD